MERARWQKGDELGNVFEKNNDGFKWSVVVRMEGVTEMGLRTQQTDYYLAV